MNFYISTAWGGTSEEQMASVSFTFSKHHVLCTFTAVIHQTAMMDHIHSAGGNSEDKQGFRDALCLCITDLCQEVGNTSLTWPIILTKLPLVVCKRETDWYVGRWRWKKQKKDKTLDQQTSCCFHTLMKSGLTFTRWPQTKKMTSTWQSNNLLILKSYPSVCVPL